MPFSLDGAGNLADFDDLEVPPDVFDPAADFDCLLAEFELVDLLGGLLATAAGLFALFPFLEVAFPFAVSWLELSSPDAITGVISAVAFLDVDPLLAGSFEAPPAPDDPAFVIPPFAEPLVDCVAGLSLEPADDLDPETFFSSEFFLALPAVPPDAADFVFVAI